MNSTQNWKLQEDEELLESSDESDTEESDDDNDDDDGDDSDFHEEDERKRDLESDSDTEWKRINLYIVFEYFAFCVGWVGLLKREPEEMWVGLLTMWNFNRPMGLY
jgi:hypothetical protein